MFESELQKTFHEFMRYLETLDYAERERAARLAAQTMQYIMALSGPKGSKPTQSTTITCPICGNTLTVTLS